jgi:hypothetical protein
VVHVIATIEVAAGQREAFLDEFHKVVPLGVLQYPGRAYHRKRAPVVLPAQLFLSPAFIDTGDEAFVAGFLVLEQERAGQQGRCHP